MAKPNLKSVRLSDEALHIVENHQGVGFNEKFELLVMEYHWSVKKREDQLEELEKKIKVREDHLHELDNQTYRMAKIITSAKEIEKMLDSLKDQVSNVSH